MDWMVPTHIAEDGSSLLVQLIQRLISFRSTITNTPDIIFYPCLGIPWPKSSWHMKLMITGPITVTRWRNVLWPEDSTVCWKTCFPMELSWHSCWKSVDHKHMGLFLDSILFHPSACLSLHWYHTILVLRNLLKFCVKCFKIRRYKPSRFLLLFEDYFGYSESLVLPYNFRISLFISEKAVKIFIRIALHFYSILTILSSNLWLNTVILNIFICSVGISFYSESFPQPNTVLLPPISYMLLLAKILHFCIAPTMYYIRIILYYCFLSQLRGGTFPYTSIVS